MILVKERQAWADLVPKYRLFFKYNFPITGCPAKYEVELILGMHSSTYFYTYIRFFNECCKSFHISKTTFELSL